MLNLSVLSEPTWKARKTGCLQLQTPHICHLVMLVSVKIHFALIYVSASSLQSQKLQKEPCAFECQGKPQWYEHLCNPFFNFWAELEDANFHPTVCPAFMQGFRELMSPAFFSEDPRWGTSTKLEILCFKELSLYSMCDLIGARWKCSLV